MRFFVYLLECRDGSYYCGIAADLGKRLKAHNSGKGAKYTRSRLPARLIYFEKAKSKSLALKREAQIKALSRKQKEELAGNS